MLFDRGYMTDTAQNLGEIIRLGRAAKSLSQGEFARIAGVSTRWISLAETNRLPTNVRSSQIKMVAKALDREPEELLKMMGLSEPPGSEARRIKDSVAKLQMPVESLESLLNWVTMFDTIPLWRERLLDLCNELKGINAKSLEPDIHKAMRFWAADVALRKMTERLKQIGLSDFTFDDDELSLEELWSGIFSRANRSLWATNLSRLGTLGGRSDKEWAIDIQRKARERAGRSGFITRLFVLHDAELYEGSELQKLSEVLSKQWDVGIKIGLVRQKRFEQLFSQVKTLYSRDFVLLDGELVFFTILNGTYDRVDRCKFSKLPDQVRAATEFIECLERSNNGVRWFEAKEDPNSVMPGFASELESIRDLE